MRTRGRNTGVRDEGNRSPAKLGWSKPKREQGCALQFSKQPLLQSENGGPSSKQHHDLNSSNRHHLSVKTRPSPEKGRGRAVASYVYLVYNDSIYGWRMGDIELAAASLRIYGTMGRYFDIFLASCLVST